MRSEPVASKKLLQLVALLREKGPMRAGDLGFAMWNQNHDVIRTENATATMHCRTATKMLYRAEKLGLVRWKEHGPKTRLWYAV